MQSGVGDTGEAIYLTQTNNPYIQLYPSINTNQENSINRVPQPLKSIRYTSYGNTPELPPQYWVASRLSHQQLHKSDFRCRRILGIPELQR